MNFTKRTEYALRALIEIGLSDENVPVKRDILGGSFHYGDELGHVQGLLQEGRRPLPHRCVGF